MITFDLGLVKGMRNAQDFMQKHNQIVQQEQQIQKENDWQHIVMPSYHDAAAEQARHKHQQSTLGMELEALQHQGNLSRANIANQLAANDVNRLPQTIAHNNRTVDARLSQEGGVLDVMGAGQAIAEFENAFANGVLTKDTFLPTFQKAYPGFTPVTDENGALYVRSANGALTPYNEFAALYKAQQQAKGTGHANNLSGMGAVGKTSADGTNPHSSGVPLTYTGLSTGTRAVNYNGRQGVLNPSTNKVTYKDENGNDVTVSLTEKDIGRINSQEAGNVIGSPAGTETIIDPVTGKTVVRYKTNASATVQGSGTPAVLTQPASTAVDGRNYGLGVVTLPTSVPPAPQEQTAPTPVPTPVPTPAPAQQPKQDAKPKVQENKATAEKPTSAPKITTTVTEDLFRNYDASGIRTELINKAPINLVNSLVPETSKAVKELDNLYARDTLGVLGREVTANQDIVKKIQEQGILREAYRLTNPVLYQRADSTIRDLSAQLAAVREETEAHIKKFYGKHATREDARKAYIDLVKSYKGTVDANLRTLNTAINPNRGGK